jgi:hypothetical protein
VVCDRRFSVAPNILGKAMNLESSRATSKMNGMIVCTFVKLIKAKFKLNRVNFNYLWE